MSLLRKTVVWQFLLTPNTSVFVHFFPSSPLPPTFLFQGKMSFCISPASNSFSSSFLGILFHEFSIPLPNFPSSLTLSLRLQICQLSSYF